MSLLNPWFLLGVVAVGAPLWLHLRRKDKEKIIRFAALRFLEDQPVASHAPWQIRDLLLFLLRLLAVLLLVAAFCRPFFSSDQNGMSSSHVYILDNTLSRQADGGFETDRETILKALRQGDAREQIAVIELGLQPKVLVNFGDNREEAEARVKALSPTFQRGTFIAALRQAGLLLRQSLGEQKKITVLTDHQKNQWEENLNTPPFLNAGTVEISNLPAQAVRPNYSLGDTKIQRFYMGETSMVQCAAQLAHTGEVTQAEIIWTVNGQDISRQTLDLNPRSDKMVLLAKWETDPALWQQGSIRVRGVGDSLPQDDVVYFTQPPIVEGQVALLSESIYLKSALSGPVAKGKWKTRVLSPADLGSILAESPGQDADILVIDGNYLQSSEARQLVERYFEAGRGVFMLVGKSSTLSTGFLRELGFEPRPTLERGSEPLKPIRYFSPDSPIFKPFGISDFGNLLEIRIGNNLILDSSQAKPLLFSDQGEGLLYEGSRRNGRFLLSTFAFDRKQTDWGTHPTFVPFLDLALQFLRPQPSLNASLEPGEIWQVRIPADRDVKTVALRSTVGILSKTEVPPVKKVSLRAPDQPGLYALSYDDDPEIQQMLAVNVSTKESELQYLQADPDALKAWTLVNVGVVKTETAPAPALPDSTAWSQDWWWKLLLLGMVFLFLEMVLLVKRKELSA